MLQILTIVFCTLPLFLEADTTKAEINSIILEQISTMPTGGGYSASSEVLRTFASSIVNSPTHGLTINSAVDRPSFCSAATYMVFLKTLVQLQKNAIIRLPQQTWDTLLVRMQPDGVDIWGRWNANGPGTACLFHELKLGTNFTDFKRARPGDFMKIFWTLEVGKFEQGHSVIYLGTKKGVNGETVRFWSSNIPGGYGEKSVPRSKIKLAIFSRLIDPQKIENFLSPRNDYLASLLIRRSSFQEALQQCGATDGK